MSGEAALALVPKIRIVASRLTSRRPAALDFNDLCSVGFIGAMEAVERYDPASGFKLNTFSEQRIRGAMLDEIRRVVGRTAPRGLAVEVPESLGFTVPTRSPSPYDLCLQREMAALLERVFCTLPEREFTVLWLYYFRELKDREIGVLLGVKDARVSQLKSKALSTLRTALRRAGLTNFAEPSTKGMQ